jgi:Zn-dependent peptidase ImmA (M78 family)
MAKLDRGFKSWSERVAAAMRTELGIAPHAPLPVRQLAEHLGVVVITPADVPGMTADDLKQLTHTDKYGWSAVSFTVDGSTTIIQNAENSVGRQSSDLMHELAHMILEHEPSQLILLESGQFAMRSFDEKQEDEANWLAGALLLPRTALVHCIARRLSSSAIAQEYVVSERLVIYRRGITGVDLQHRRRVN